MNSLGHTKASAVSSIFMCGLVNVHIVHIVDIVEIVDIHSEIVKNSKMVRDFLLFKLEFFCIESRDKF